MVNLVQSGIGNIGSIKNVLNNMGYETNIVFSSIQFNHNFKKIILPGVGSFDSFINSLKINGLFNEIKRLVLDEKFKILGICVGMQSLFEKSEEGVERGLDLIKGNLAKFKNSHNFKVPHMGWNEIEINKTNKLLDNLPKKRFYFAHSYYLENISEDIILSNTNHNLTFPSSINFKNIYGTQFHPEKSFAQGHQILKNFIEKC